MTRYIAALGLAIIGMLFAGLPAVAQTPATVKLCVPTSASICPPVTATAPLPVTPVAPASGTYIGNVGGFDIEVAFTPTLDAGAYASGDALFDLQTVAFQLGRCASEWSLDHD